MTIARGSNPRADTRFASWKVENAWYEEHRNHATGDAYRCSIAAQCPKNPWPSHGQCVWYPFEQRTICPDSDKRTWFNTGFTGSMVEVRKIRCTRGGYLR